MKDHNVEFDYFIKEIAQAIQEQREARRVYQR